MPPSGEGSPNSASFDSESRYVIRTVDFAPARLRRYDLWAQSRAIFCAGLMLVVTFAAVNFAAALHLHVSDMAVIAGAFDHAAHACALHPQLNASVRRTSTPKSYILSAYARSSSLPAPIVAPASGGSKGENRDVGPSTIAAMHSLDPSGFEHAVQQG